MRKTKHLHFLALLIALLSFGLGLFHRVKVRSPRQVGLRTLKSVSEALTPILAMMGGVGVLLGMITRQPWVMLTGLAGSALSIDYAQKVARTNGQAHNIALPPSRTHLPNFRSVEPRWLRDIPYWVPPGAVQPLLCDLWLPPPHAQINGTALLYFHGGGFFTSHKDFGTRPFFQHLAQLGYCILDIDYRLAPEVDLLTIQADARRALAWAKTNLPALDLQVDRFILSGGSAGGLLALLLAYTRNHPQLTPPDLLNQDLSVQGVISYYGIVDLLDLYNRLIPLESENVASAPSPDLFDQNAAHWGVIAGAWLKGVEPDAMRVYLRENAALMRLGPRKALRALLGGDPEGSAERFSLLSPVTHAGPKSPPTLLIHGEHDYLLPVASTRALYQKLRDAGAPVYYVELPLTEHTFDLFLPRVSPPARAALRHVSRFLAAFETRPS